MPRGRAQPDAPAEQPVTGEEELLEDNEPKEVVESPPATKPANAFEKMLSPRNKRPAAEDSPSISKKPRLPNASSTQAVPAENNLKDSVKPGLILISIGLNPGIMTGKLGHAYAHPSNRYWPTLYASGITPVLHKPAETFSLMDLYGIGHTNIIPTKATVGGADLTKDDYLEGAKVLDEKIRELKPQAVMIVGKGIWEEWFRYKRGRKMTKKDNFNYGWQDPKLNIGRKQGEWEEQRNAIWKPMGDWFTPKRDEWIANAKSNTITTS